MSLQIDPSEVSILLSEHGYAFIPRAIPNFLLARVREDFHEKREGGFFRPAAIGRAESTVTDVSIRGDEICWWHSPYSPLQQELTDEFEWLRKSINERLFLGLFTSEFHYARYPKGALYARHVDTFREEQSRVISLVSYLNSEWSEADGGELILQARTETVIRPQPGAIVLFLSELPHEVRVTHADRWTLTGWFKRRRLSGM